MFDEKKTLPTGVDVHPLGKNEEWKNINKRIEKPRILKHVLFAEVKEWYKRTFSDDPQGFSFFEAGCGHGNDLRALRNLLGDEGYYLGANISEVEIFKGIKHYKEEKRLAARLFAQGNLCDLRKLFIWDEKKEDFSWPMSVESDSFDLVYMEAVLHGLGYGEDTHRKKKQAAQKMLNELFRICKPGGRFFGRANVFRPGIRQEDRIRILHETNCWHFVPGSGEFMEMLFEAGFRVSVGPIFSEFTKIRENELKMCFLMKK